MRYRKLKNIDSIKELEMEIGKNIIINGSVNKTGWMWRMKGVFEKREGKIFFRNEHDMCTEVIDKDVELTVLECI